MKERKSFRKETFLNHNSAMLTGESTDNYDLTSQAGPSETRGHTLINGMGMKKRSRKKVEGGNFPTGHRSRGTNKSEKKKKGGCGL